MRNRLLAGGASELLWKEYEHSFTKHELAFMKRTLSSEIFSLFDKKQRRRRKWLSRHIHQEEDISLKNCFLWVEVLSEISRPRKAILLTTQGLVQKEKYIECSGSMMAAACFRILA